MPHPRQLTWRSIPERDRVRVGIALFIRNYQCASRYRRSDPPSDRNRLNRRQNMNSDPIHSPSPPHQANVAPGTSSARTGLERRAVRALEGTTRKRYSPPSLGCAGMTAADHGGDGWMAHMYLHARRIMHDLNANAGRSQPHLNGPPAPKSASQMGNCHELSIASCPLITLNASCSCG